MVYDDPWYHAHLCNTHMQAVARYPGRDTVALRCLRLAERELGLRPNDTNEEDGE